MLQFFIAAEARSKALRQGAIRDHAHAPGPMPHFVAAGVGMRDRAEGMSSAPGKVEVLTPRVELYCFDARRSFAGAAIILTVAAVTLIYGLRSLPQVPDRISGGMTAVLGTLAYVFAKHRRLYRGRWQWLRSRSARTSGST